MKKTLKPAVDDVRHVLDGLTQAVVSADRHGRIVTMNPAAERLRGIPAKTAMGQPLRKLFVLLDADTREEVRLPTPAAFSKDPQTRHFTRAMLLTEEDKPDVIVDAAVSSTHDARGRWNGCVLALVDIRDTIIRERGVMDRQRIEAIRAMAANMARDFNSWLSVISGHASSILESVTAQTSAHGAAVKILEATRHAGGLMKRLLTVARADKTDTTGLQSVQTVAVLQETVNLARATFLGDTISIRLRRNSENPYVAANGIQLLSCLMNLIRNAKEAMPRGGTITLDVSERQVGKKTYVMIAVRDTGVGMSRETLESIFTPFFSTKQPATGTGLGLTVVRTLVESWGGFVRVRSQLNRGASFQLFLPSAPKPADEPAPRAQPAAVEDILVADDSPEMIAEARQILESAGYRVLSASSGRQCVELHRQHADRVALILLDALMPGETPRQTLDQILATDPTVGVVMISGFSRDYLRTQLERGSWGFVQKPFDPPMLLGAVQRTLEQRRIDSNKTAAGTP